MSPIKDTMDKLFIAEYKPFTPHEGRVSQEHIADFIDRMTHKAGDIWMLSVYTDERWMGSYHLLASALGRSWWPVMARGTNVYGPMVVKAGGEWYVTHDMHDEADPFAIYEVVMGEIR